MVHPDGPMALALLGTVVTLDPEASVVEDGAVYVDGGTIVDVRAAAEPPPDGLGSVTRIRTEGFLYPGLVDLHNHLAYNVRSLWFPPRAEPYATRNQWPNAATYGAEITQPAKLLAKVAAKAVLKFAEAKAVVGGTTAIQGAPGISRPYEGWLVRNIDNETFGTSVDRIRQSVINLSSEDLEPYAGAMRDGSAFVYHLAEGTDEGLLEEFDDVERSGCLQDRLIAIHATALGRAQFSTWAGEGAGAIVWSPFSNLWLYRDTTKVVEARDEGLLICLGADWGPSGSKNVLGELKVADLWNRARLDGAFSDLELCRMVTSNAGEALGRAWGQRIGRLEPGLAADLVATARVHDDPYRNLIESTERHVRLVLVGGRPAFGNESLMEEAGAVGREPITVAGIRRSIAMVDPTIPDADVSWPQVLEELESARSDPVRAFEASLARPRGEAPLELLLDMPEGVAARSIASPRDAAAVVVPSIDSIFHDAAFLHALAPDRAPILGGALEGLDAYY
jgi:cytosine/adenosine deaminase-related metal-dependent hydrolase